MTIIIVLFLPFFVFELRARTGRTADGRARHAVQPIGQPHNNCRMIEEHVTDNVFIIE